MHTSQTPQNKSKNTLNYPMSNHKNLITLFILFLLLITGYADAGRDKKVNFGQSVILPDFAPKSTTPPCLPRFAEKSRHYKSQLTQDIRG
jgi:hypothetical protein